jgi:hypothetical protein
VGKSGAKRGVAHHSRCHRFFVPCRWAYLQGRMIPASRLKR